MTRHLRDGVVHETSWGAEIVTVPEPGRWPATTADEDERIAPRAALRLAPQEQLDAVRQVRRSRVELERRMTGAPSRVAAREYGPLHPVTPPAAPAIGPAAAVVGPDEWVGRPPAPRFLALGGVVLRPAHKASWSTAAVADLFAVQPGVVHLWRRQGRLSGTRTRLGRWRYTGDEVSAFLRRAHATNAVDRAVRS